MGAHQATFDDFEILVQNIASINEISLQQTLIIEAQNVKRKNADLSVQVLLFHIFAASLGQELEGQNFLVNSIIGHKLSVDDEILGRVRRRLCQEVNHVGVGRSHVLEVAGVDLHEGL